jgi:hypothetical protein
LCSPRRQHFAGITRSGTIWSGAVLVSIAQTVPAFCRSDPLHIHISHRGIGMKKLTNLVAGLAAALLCVASVSPSHAAPTTAYVSAGGNDANPCTLAQPCRSIGQANLIAGSGGTVSCLDAGPYNEAFNTTSAYTLDCRGVVYAMANFFAAYVYAQPNGALVTFRNVTFDGVMGGAGAVQIGIGSRVVFENCTFQNFTTSPGDAVEFEPSAADAQLTITDSVFANNGLAGSGGGIYIRPFAGITAGAVIERTQVTGNTYGIIATGFGGGTALVEVRSSSIASNIFDGIWAVSQGTTATIVVEHSASLRNGGSGVNAQGPGAYVSLSDSTVAWNATGVTASGGGLIPSYKNNIIAGNLSPGVAPTGFGLQ